eukprot:scaffold225908_cov20-Tisochrysis_lutea.AAC.1
MLAHHCNYDFYRYEFPGKKWIDAAVDLPFALPTSVAGLTLATVYSIHYSHIPRSGGLLLHAFMPVLWALLQAPTPKFLWLPSAHDGLEYMLAVVTLVSLTCMRKETLALWAGLQTCVAVKSMQSSHRPFAQPRTLTLTRLSLVDFHSCPTKCSTQHPMAQLIDRDKMLPSIAVMKPSWGVCWRAWAFRESWVMVRLLGSHEPWCALLVLVSRGSWCACVGKPSVE